MSIITSPLLLGADKAAGYTISRSLRFNSSDSAYLSRTPGSAGNRRTWTWAGWVKRSDVVTQQSVWSGGSSGTNRSNILFQGTNELRFFNYAGSVNVDLVTTPVFRDPSAWYHIVLAADTTQATAADRIKIYVNGTQITTFSTSTYPSPNLDLVINSAIGHSIGRAEQTSPAEHFSGYLADIYFIDGQALTPSSFTEVSATTGQLIPKAYTGSFGTNGFWLQFADNSNNTATTLGKDTSGNNNNWDCFNLQTTTGGPTSVAAASGALPIYNTTDTYGTTKGTGTRTDSNSSSIALAVPMDGVNNGTTFTDESATIKGSGSAKAITRFGNAKTVTTQSKYYGSSAFLDGTSDYLEVADNADFDFGSGDFTVEWWEYRISAKNDVSTINRRLNISGSNNSVWMFNYESGGSFISYFNDGAGTIYLQLTYGPVLYNRWMHYAVTRFSGTVRIFQNGVQVSTGTLTQSLSAGGQPLSIGRMQSGYLLNAYLQDIRIYKGVAKYTSNFNPPSSTQNPTVAAGNDSLVDTPSSGSQVDTGLGGQVTGNYATLNPLAAGFGSNNQAGTLSNGNLDWSTASTTYFANAVSTIAPRTGKYYVETICQNASYSGIGFVNAASISGVTGNYGLGAPSDGWFRQGTLVNNNTSNAVTGMAALAVGDIVGLALDLDNGKAWWSKNGVWHNSGDPASGTNATVTFTPGGKDWLIGLSLISPASAQSINFGQRQWAYAAPSGFRPLVDTLLPAPVVAKSSTVMDVKLYTGNGSTQSITGLAFNPDLVWIKSRNNAYDHKLTDALRGATKGLISDSTGAETTDTNGLTAFNSDGFSLGTDTNYNGNAATYVAWTWDAGSSTATNTQGSITSQVRANASAGFSIVSYTGTGTSPVSVGHGLNIAPTFLIFKNRDDAVNWQVWTTAISSSGTILEGLNTTAAGTTPWTYISTTSSLIQFNSGNSAQTTNGKKFICYAFSPVAGYSSFGSYTGNGSTDGPFVYTGFRPRFLMLKRTDSTDNWAIIDTARSSYNVSNHTLWPNSNSAEATAYSGGAAAVPNVDFTANGLKLRAGADGSNVNAATYIYAAFAESPFQYSRAR